jgi:hypothetical protein
MAAATGEAELKPFTCGQAEGHGYERGVQFERPRKMTPHQRQEALRRLAMRQ